MKFSPVLAVAAAVVALASCGKKTEAPAAPADASPSAGQAAASDAPVVANAPAFDLSRVPVSNAELGAFPYIKVPAGYSADAETTMDLAAFPIWDGQAFNIVEGKVYMANSGTLEGKTYSRFEYQRAIDSQIQALGGVKIAAESEAPSEAIDAVSKSLRSDMQTGLGSIYGRPITTYVIRRADKTIWIHLLLDSTRANWAVVESPPAA